MTIKYDGQIGKVLGRAIRLKCPSCGQMAIFKSFLAINKSCANCGLAFQPEPGFYVGAIYINVAITYFVILGAFLISLIFSWAITDLTFFTMVALAAIVPVSFFRWSRSFWLALNFLVLKPDRTLNSR